MDREHLTLEVEFELSSDVDALFLLFVFFASFVVGNFGHGCLHFIGLDGAMSDL